ncbi:MAG: hypothetical protein HPY55_11205 [Firmicutes bacterium]|nr:hypothetical protein [Bacillota bacterium]
MKRLGIVVAGQSPQPDYNEMMERYVFGIEVVQAGALDAASIDEIHASVEEGGFHLAVRLKDGTPVEVSHRLVSSGLPAAVRSLAADGCGVILVACTGDFDPSVVRVSTGHEPGPVVLFPGEILLAFASSVWAGQPVAVCVPLAEQQEWARERWGRRGVKPIVIHQPMCEDESSAAIRVFEALGGRPASHVGGIVMDCMGYTEAEARNVRERTGLPVVCARGLVALSLKALLV